MLTTLASAVLPYFLTRSFLTHPCMQLPAPKVLKPMAQAGNVTTLRVQVTFPPRTSVPQLAGKIAVFEVEIIEVRSLEAPVYTSRDHHCTLSILPPRAARSTRGFYLSQTTISRSW